MQERVGEQRAVVCMLLYNRPPAATPSRLGVEMGLP
jgi:hypothetical protein